MSQIHLWQIGVDLTLVAILVLFVARTIRGGAGLGSSPRLLELESSLKGLIAEAESAGRSLNDQLIRREQNLQKLLEETQQSESNIRALNESASNEHDNLRAELSRAREVVQEVRRSLQTIRTELGGHSAEIEIEREQRRVETDTVAPRTEAPSPRRPSSSAPFEESRPAPVSPIELKSTVENAEVLLRNGVSTEEVSRTTRLEPEQVRLLKQMIEIERNETKPKARPIEHSDERLGVLSVMRRQVQTL